MKMLRATWAIIAVAVAGGAFVLFFAGWRQSASGSVNAGQWAVAAVIGVLALAALYDRARMEGLYQRLSSITRNIAEGVCAISADGRLTFVNRAAADIIELPSLNIAIDDPIYGGSLTAPDFLLAPAFEAMRTGQAIREHDALFRGKNGDTIPVAYTASAIMTDGTPSGAVITFRDITERKAFEDELRQHAFYDSLTGLANRRLLVERLERALRRSALDGRTHALIFVDVDRFKNINDSLGHVTGDALLAVIAARMKGAVRGHDLLARFGGDEFVVLLQDVSGVEVAVAAARRICLAVEQPMVLPDGHELVASVSAGIALTEPGSTADDVLRNADVAMYDAKTKGEGGRYKVFDQAAMGSRSSERLHHAYLVSLNATYYLDARHLSQDGVADGKDLRCVPSSGPAGCSTRPAGR